MNRLLHKSQTKNIHAPVVNLVLTPVVTNPLLRARAFSDVYPNNPIRKRVGTKLQREKVISTKISMTWPSAAPEAKSNPVS